MATNEKTITIEDSDSHVIQNTIKTTGYMIFFIEYDKIKMLGDLDLRGIAPLLMKLAMEKFSK